MVAGLSLRDRVRSSEIQEGLRVEPLLLHMVRSKLRWFGPLVRIGLGLGFPAETTIHATQTWISKRR